MKCIHFHCPSFPALSQLKNNQKLKRMNVPWLPPSTPTRLLQSQKTFLLATRAMDSPLVMGAGSPTTTGDITIMLQTSAALLFVYWIANFVVPEIIYKDLQKNEMSQEQNPNDNDANALEEEEGSTG